MSHFTSLVDSKLRASLRVLSVLVLLCGGCTTARPNRSAQGSADTTVYVVRHAEKDTTPGLADPALTPAGQQRAQALREAIGKSRTLGAIFTTNTTRTRTTVEPLAQDHKLTAQVYDARQLPALAQRVRRQYKGQQVVVVGHSNTILETVEALGAPRPVPTVGDNEYDYLLEVRIPRDSTQAPTATARRYGVPSVK